MLGKHICEAVCPVSCIRPTLVLKLVLYTCDAEGAPFAGTRSGTMLSDLSNTSLHDNANYR